MEPDRPDPTSMIHIREDRVAVLKKVTAALFAGIVAAGMVSAADAADLKVGVSAGPYGDILRFAGDIAEKEGINVEIVEFSDYTLPNEALNAGEIDVNNFQHRPYLDNQVAQRGYELVAVEPSIIVPTAVYSSKVKALSELKDGATIAIPNDPSNGARALQLLEKGGLLKLDPDAGAKATPFDVTDNPKDLKIVELDAAQLPRSLGDVDAAVCMLNYAMSSGLNPKDSLLIEDEQSEWGLWFVTRTENKDDPTIRRYMEIYRSPEVKEFILTKFDGTIIPAW
jgi:D-methionine transport system substrate-binding protein